MREVDVLPMNQDHLQRLRDLTELPHLMEAPEEEIAAPCPEGAESPSKGLRSGRGLMIALALLWGVVLGGFLFALGGDSHAPSSEAPCHVLALDPATSAACGPCECVQLVVD